MRKTQIEIYHKAKYSDNLIRHILVYRGGCMVNEKFSSREQLGGAENNSEIGVRIFTSENIPVSCGDRCILDGQIRTVRKYSACQSGVSEAFKHIALSLR
ncbi:MAG: hypothetical protein IKJ06_03730 [Clostridia bacterium]|nr:hypothetical protein [Clostridia bacterium]